SDRKQVEADRQQVERQLFEEKELAQVTLHSIGDAVITTDAAGRVQYCNPVAERLTGWEAEEAKGRPLHEVFRIINETTRDPTENPVSRVLREGCIIGLANHTLLITRDGTERSIDDSAAPIRNRDGHVIGAVLVFHDVTEARMLARQLTWQASHDPLTGLVNRRQFEQELLEALRGAKFNNQQHVLCYLDLDQFKVVNDTSGHMAGDELLRQVALVLKARIRGADILARLGGDEFAILLKQCPLEQAEAIAKTMQDAIQDFRFVWQDKTFRIAISIGLVPLLSASRDLISVMSAADAACYAAKIRGRNRIHVYQTDDSELVRQRHEQQWSIRIRDALEENRFCLYRQAVVPTTECSANQETHYEILLRMIDESGALVLPTVFIPAAERYGLMQQIDHWVVQTFLAHIAQSRQYTPSGTGGAEARPYMINLSGASLSDEQFLSFLRTQFNEYPSAPQSICFEITETAAISNLNQAIHFIHELKQLGCRFALDDFGSGMSSFGYLKTLPVDFVKIDGKFIEDMASDPTASAIVESINHIGHVMGLQTIAEWVDNATTRTRLGEIGVDFVQGYGIGIPTPLT
nr:EAL domain-containing protein [Leptolyngbyaceae cyanobacterium MO_188.B28]